MLPLKSLFRPVRLWVPVTMMPAPYSTAVWITVAWTSPAGDNNMVSIPSPKRSFILCKKSSVFVFKAISASSGNIPASGLPTAADGSTTLSRITPAPKSRAMLKPYSTALVEVSLSSAAINILLVFILHCPCQYNACIGGQKSQDNTCTSISQESKNMICRNKLHVFERERRKSGITAADAGNQEQAPWQRGCAEAQLGKIKNKETDQKTACDIH